MAFAWCTLFLLPVYGETKSVPLLHKQIPEDALPGSSWKLLDDFENPARWTLKRPKFSDQTGSVQVSDLQRGPFAGSGRYLSMLFRGRQPTPAILEPEAPIQLPGYSQYVSIYVYGWDQPVRLGLILLDRNGKKQRVGAESLQFQGWKRTVFKLPDELRRRPRGPFQEWYLHLVGIEIRPIYNSILTVRLSLEDLRVLSAPPLQLAPPMGEGANGQDPSTTDGPDDGPNSRAEGDNQPDPALDD